MVISPNRSWTEYTPDGTIEGSTSMAHLTGALRQGILVSTTSVLTPQQRQTRATAGAFVGTANEWYDLLNFGTAAALVCGMVFYVDIAPDDGILATFAHVW